MITVLFVILFLMFLGGLPGWGYHPYGYWPSGGAGLILLILVILLLVGRI